MTRRIKVAKKKQELVAEVPLVQLANKWSRSIRSWIAEYRLLDKTTPRRSFDSLFSDGGPTRDSHQNAESSGRSVSNDKEGTGKSDESLISGA